MGLETDAVQPAAELRDDPSFTVGVSRVGSQVRSHLLQESKLHAGVHPLKSRLGNNRQIATRLGLSFALMIGMFLGTGYWAAIRVARGDLGLQDALARRTAKLQLAHEAIGYSNDNSRIIMQLFLEKNPASPDLLLARRAANSQRISELIADLESQSDSEREQQLLLSVNQARNPYVDSYQRALRLLLGRREADRAEAVMLEETLPALFAYHAAWNEFARFEIEEIKRAAEKARERDINTRRIGLSLAWLAGILAAAIAVFVTRRIASDTKARIRMQEEVSNLNALLEQRVSERTDELVRTDKQLRDSLADTQEYAGEIEAINELVKLLQSCLTLDEARQQASRVLQQFFAAGSVLMLNPSRNLLDVVLSWGGASTKQGPFAPQSCWALRKGQLHLVGPQSLSLPCSHSDEKSAACRLCIPMIAQGDSLGVLTIDDASFCGSGVSPREGRHRQKLAATLGEQISLAFANLVLRETLKYQSVRDALTGLFNRRYMEESLERELLRAARNGKPVTVLMIDIDNFKRLNDMFGHDAGDVMLRELGAFFNSKMRGGDIACRYGGEEFLLIMAETGLEAGCERADVLREQVKALQVPHRGQILRQITVSIGVAGFPDHGTSGSQIVECADEALYRAKAAGRDQVVLAARMEVEPSVRSRQN